MSVERGDATISGGLAMIRIANVSALPLMLLSASAALSRQATIRST
jgi:hypothetical protein